MTIKEASMLKYIGVYLLAVFPYNLISKILLTLSAEAMFTNLSIAIIVTMVDLAIWCGIFIYVYSKFDDIDTMKVFPWIAGLTMIGIIYIFVVFQSLHFLEYFNFMLFLAIAEPIAFLYIFYNHFKTKTYDIK